MCGFFWGVFACFERRERKGRKERGAHTGIGVRRRRRRACMHNIKLNKEWMSKVYLLLFISFAFVCVVLSFPFCSCSRIFPALRAFTITAAAGAALSLSFSMFVCLPCLSQSPSFSRSCCATVRAVCFALAWLSILRPRVELSHLFICGAFC